MELSEGWKRCVAMPGGLREGMGRNKNESKKYRS
jgi:hypothetical protein